MQDISRPHFVVTFHNPARRPLVLSLGFTLEKEYPSAIHFVLTDAQGNDSILDLAGPGLIAGIAGPYLMHLSANATDDVPIDLDGYIIHHEPHTPVIFVSSLPSGQYTLRAKYTGLDVCGQPVDHPTKINRSTPYWTGTVLSNPVLFSMENTMRRPGSVASRD
jgi:hypothetical protein